MPYYKEGHFTNVQTVYNKEDGSVSSTSSFYFDVSTDGTGLYGMAHNGSVTVQGIQKDVLLIDRIYSVVNTESIAYKFYRDGTLRKEGSRANYVEASTDGWASQRKVVGLEEFKNPADSYKTYTILNGKATFPIFDNETDAQKYVDTGDDSGAINYDELHGVKIDIYGTNNGDRITFTPKTQEDGSIVLADKIEYKFLAYIEDSLIHSTWTHSTTVQQYSTSWDDILSNMGIIGKLYRRMNFSIDIYYEGQIVSNLQGHFERKLLIGNVIAYATKGTDRGYNLFLSTDNTFDEIEQPTEEDSDAEDNPQDGDDFGGFSNLCVTYQISKQALDDLGNFIWNNSIFDDLKNINNSPIENVVSLQYMPCSIGGTGSHITLGNIETNVSGQKLSHNMTKINVASFTVPKTYSDFLAFEPFTSLTLYLPFVGMVSLNPTDCCGHTLSIDYVFDVVVGSFGVMVYTSKGGGKTLIYSSQGTCSITIPLTASNNSQVQSAIIQNGASLIGSVIANDVGGSLGSVGNIVMAQHHSTTFGTPSSMVGALSPTKCYYILRSPLTSLPSTFAHTKGWLCRSSYKLSDLKGFTKLSADVEVQGGFSKDGNEKLKSILTSGFYI